MGFFGTSMGNRLGNIWTRIHCGGVAFHWLVIERHGLQGDHGQNGIFPPSQPEIGWL